MSMKSSMDRASVVSRGLAGRRAFTVIEVLVVIAVIALIISIVVPTLGRVRDAAKKTDTLATCNGLSQAITSFRNDNRRLPGLYPIANLATTNSLTTPNGMTALENAMVELVGMKTQATGGAGFTSIPSPLGGGAPPTYVGLTTRTGTGYFVPSQKQFVNSVGSPIQELVDSFGQPILLWQEDDAAVGRITADGIGGPRIAGLIADPSNPTSRAKFYLVSNSSALNSVSFGAQGTNVKDDCFLGLGGVVGPRQEAALAALMGSPAYPSNLQAPVDQIYATETRGSYAVHSGGRDGLFLGNKDKGGAVAGGSGGTLRYGHNFKNNAGDNISVGPDGKTPFDVIAGFDDIVVYGN
ncbi:MAG: type II secretion system protein [Phycisphaerales bacterium]